MRQSVARLGLFGVGGFLVFVEAGVSPAEIKPIAADPFEGSAATINYAAFFLLLIPGNSTICAAVASFPFWPKIDSNVSFLLAISLRAISA